MTMTISSKPKIVVTASAIQDTVKLTLSVPDAEIHIAATKDGMIANTEKTLAACQVDPRGFRKYLWLRRNKEIEN